LTIVANKPIIWNITLPELQRKEVNDFELASHPHRSINIPIISGADIHQVLKQRDVYMNQNVPGLLDRTPKPESAATANLVQFQLGELGFIYEYGLEGLVTITAILKQHGMELCPQLTGPMLAMLNSDFVQIDSTHVLSEPITAESGHELVYIVSPKKNGVGVDAYMVGALYHDSQVIVSIANTK